MTSLEHRIALLAKFYGGERQPYMHKFNVANGVCDFCHIFIGNCKIRMCPVITDDEPASFTIEDLS